VAVELADLDLGAELDVADVHPAERDVPLQRRRVGAARDHLDLVAAGVDAVAVGGRLVTLELEADERPLRVGAPFCRRFGRSNGGRRNATSSRRVAVKLPGSTASRKEKIRLPDAVFSPRASPGLCSIAPTRARASMPRTCAP